MRNEGHLIDADREWDAMNKRADEREERIKVLVGEWSKQEGEVLAAIQSDEGCLVRAFMNPEIDLRGVIRGLLTQQVEDYLD